MSDGFFQFDGLGYLDPVCAELEYKYLSWVYGVDRKSVMRGTDQHHEARQVMLNSDPKGRIFLSTPFTHDRYFFLHTFDLPRLISKVELAIK